MDIDEVADELYGLDPADFVAVRSERVAQARADGDRELAREIGLLRKPTMVGWAVNVLARESADDLAALLEVGDALREAQRALSADQLRSLDKQRQQVVRGLTRRAAALAADHGRTLSENSSREVGQTLGAAMADPQFGEQVRLGRVISAVQHAGFGGSEEAVGRAGLRVIDGGASTERAPGTVEQQRLLRAALDDAQALLDEAENHVAQTQDSLHQARSDRLAGEERVDRLQAELAEAQAHLQDLRHAEDDAKTTRAHADRTRQAAQSAVDRARAALDE
ncbi:hypothetical protein [Gordonia hydrophobica]|uniref:Transposase n=1 Tax=Gordonia hydrophobica TaxID=40516 RepID=A0ABZ2U147_9ACTN|nr:hypothetical protein [Gordonia hydrophobica]MBM7367226.1 exonuclease VII small subunit [Gordonia hydrophobica]